MNRRRQVVGDEMSLPQHLQVCAELLRDVGLVHADASRRAAIFAAVYDDLSDRNLAAVLHEVLGGDVHELLAEAIASYEALAGSQDAADARRSLAEAGWEYDDG
ncbi:hypothetical protein ACFVJS_11850 [Nocardioides sp. NPDC057772]|uniref:hypothetical protein n=1 Tax=Nocardioides sp. NPDC057772 TaxID=3346245 RepID=UPI00366FA958